MNPRSSERREGNPRMKRWKTRLVACGAALGLAAVSFALGPMARGQAAEDGPGLEAIPPDRGAAPPRSEGRRDTVYLTQVTVNRLGVRSEPARASTRPGVLVLSGVF